MSIRLSLLTFAGAALVAASFGPVARAQGITGDPRIDGVIPHTLPDPDPYILSDPKGVRLPGIRPSGPPIAPVRPRASTASAPATGTEPATTSAPATGPEPATASAPAAGAEPATTSAPATGPEKVGEAGAPSTTAASDLPAKPDFSTPKAAVKSYYLAMTSGSRDAVKTCFAPPKNDEEKDLLETGIDEQINAPPLMAALKEKFPADASKMPDMVKITLTMMDRTYADATEEINGDQATVKPVAPAGASGPMFEPTKVVKVGDEWKLPIESGRFLHKLTPDQKAMSVAMAQLYAEAVADVKAGKYASFEEANKDIEAKRAAVRAKFAPAPPVPTPAPAPASAGPRSETAIAVKFVAYDDTNAMFPVKLELTNNSGKDLSRIQGTLFFKDADNKTLHVTGYTADYRTPFAAGKSSSITIGKPNNDDLIELLKDSPNKVMLSFQAASLNDKDGAEEKF